MFWHGRKRYDKLNVIKNIKLKEQEEEEEEQNEYKIEHKYKWP